MTEKLGDIYFDASSIIENPPTLIPISPRLDIALGGGVPEGSLFTLTGPEKIGKTMIALQLCRNAQDIAVPEGERRKCWFANTEGRIKKRDLEGIDGLNLDKEKFEFIGSKKGHILTGEEYLMACEDKILHDPHSVIVVDSFSNLCSESEMKSALTDVQVAPMHRTIAKFCRRMGNVLPINRVILVGITHVMANISPMARKTKTEKTSNALKYQQDVKLFGKQKKDLKQGESIIGFQAEWHIENTATNTPPGQKIWVTVKYGRGLWKEYEIAELMKDFGMAKGGAWLAVDGMEKKINGLAALATYFEENPNAYQDYKNRIYEMVGLEA